MWRCCCWPKFRQAPEKINILILGLNESGKTEISHVLASKQRTDTSSTNGSRSFSRTLGNLMANITEIGGNEDMRKIWHHYYSKAHAVIYVVDLSEESLMSQSYAILSEIIQHRYMQGKSILVLANKTDMCDQPDILDFYERFPLESLANSYQTHILVQCCGQDDYTELFSGIDWLRFRIEQDFQQLKNRIKFDVETTKRDEERKKTGFRRITALSQVSSFLRRPKSAPSATSAAHTSSGGSFSINHRVFRRNRIHSANPKYDEKPGS